MIRCDADIAIVGSGFAGSILAMAARRLGRSVLLLERGEHPRFAIGESSTPLASLLLEEIARRHDLPQLLPFTKYGAWKRAYPNVGCGLKRGFSFFRHDPGAAHVTREDGGNQLLVAASPADEIGDVHWYRPDFDHFLVREAVALGVEYVDRLQLQTFEPTGDGVLLAGLRTAPAGDGAAGREREATTFRATVRLVVDATGPRGFVHRALGLGERPLPGLPPTQGLYSHFRDVRPFADVVPATTVDAPYAPDAAAVHHVFDGGWIWVLRFDNGVTSAGVAMTDDAARGLGLADGAAAWARLLDRLPSVAAQFAGSAATRAFTHVPRLSFQSDVVAGERWVMLPSAAGLVDPLLSTGFPLTLLGVERVAAAIADDWGSAALGDRLRACADRAVVELRTTARLVGALYDAFDDWERFTAVSHLYFAAASFAEAARRLGTTSVAGNSFLLLDHPTFGPALHRCLDRADALRSSRRAPGAAPDVQTRGLLMSAVADAIEPINVAGLNNPARRNRYPCLADDVLAGAPKLHATERDVRAMLERCGFRPGRTAP